MASSVGVVDPLAVTCVGPDDVRHPNPQSPRAACGSPWSRCVAELPADAFAGLTELTELDLNSNVFTGLPNGIFSDLANLRYLNLDFNAMRGANLHRDAFRGLHGLGRLGLAGNPLGGSVPQDPFFHLGSLTQVYLNDTELSSIPTFFNDLWWLDVARNRIESLAGSEISGSNIGYLNVANNRLRSIPDGFFRGYSSVHCRTRNSRLDMDGDPGSPFVFRLELTRVDAPPAAPGPATVAVRLRTGAPLPLTAGLAAVGGGSLSAGTVTIENGTTESGSVEVVGSTATVLHLVHNESLVLPPTYMGMRVELGDSLRLFALPDRTAEADAPARR